MKQHLLLFYRLSIFCIFDIKKHFSPQHQRIILVLLWCLSQCFFLSKQDYFSFPYCSPNFINFILLRIFLWKLLKVYVCSFFFSLFFSTRSYEYLCSCFELLNLEPLNLKTLLFPIFLLSCQFSPQGETIHPTHDCYRQWSQCKQCW